jgi:predicted GH43/DUF377 family glycosyl hydrolase
VLVATEPYEVPGGCEDARIVEHNGTYHMTYTGYVVFVEGLVAWRGEWLLYDGEGDAGVGVLHGRA